MQRKAGPRRPHTMRTTRRLIVASALAAMALAVSPSAMAEAAAQLRIVPTPIARGAQTTAFGSGFCSSADCSKVSIVIEGNTVATGAADDDGKIAIKFKPLVLPGQYTVTARQTTPNGTRQATTGLTVLAADTPAGQPAQTPPKTKQRATPTPTDQPKATETDVPSKSPPTTKPIPSSSAIDPAAGATDDTQGGTGGFLWWLLPALTVPALAATAVWLWRRRATPSDDGSA